MREHFGKCEIVVSAKGSVFFGGEKSGVTCGTATMLPIPRRVYVGVQRVPGLKGIQICESKIYEPMHVVGMCPADEQESTSKQISSTALRVLYEGLSFLLDEPPSGFKLYIWSEWIGESGLGWSAAFSSATAGALLHACDIKWENTADPECWNDGMLSCYTLAGLFESALHNGRANSASVTASMVNTSLPIIFKCGIDPSKDSVPRLWKLPSSEPSLIGALNEPSDFDRDEDTPLQEDFWAQRHEMIDRYMQYVTEKKTKTWTCEVLPAAGLDQLEQLILWERISSVGHILVVNTNMFGNTGMTSKKELSSALGMQLRERGYVNLNQCYALTAEAMRSLLVGEVDPARTQEAWSLFQECITRSRGMLIGLGFMFPTGDRLLCELRELAQQHAQYIGTRTTGKGTSGSLVVALPVHGQLRSSVHQHLHLSGDAPHPYVMFDSVVDIPRKAADLDCEGLRCEPSLGS